MSVLDVPSACDAGYMTTAAHTARLAGPATPSEPTVLAAWTATLVRALDALGIDGLALASEAGIDPSSFTVDDARIPLSRTTELWRLAVDATGDPCFGIEVSRFVRPTTFNALGLGIVASESFREALDRIVRFSTVVLSPSIETAVVDHKGQLVYTCHAASDTPQPSYESIEAIGASIVRAARFLMDRDVSPCEVRLERPEQPASDRFETFFRCPVRYGADHYRLAFDAAVADRLLPTRHTDRGSVADRMTADHVERVRSSGRLTDQVREVVARELADGEPTPRAVAARLAMSCRTMQRRLHEESTTFRDVVADVRIALAKHLMLSERLPTSLVAERLGFSDTAAFRRAFKRRTGMTAGEFSAQTR